MDDAYRLIRAFFESTSEGLKLLNAEPNLADARTSMGETPLHYLAVENQLEAVRALVARGAAIDTISEVHGTPILEAAQLGHVEMVKYLLSVGANISIPNQDEPTLIGGVRSGNPDIVQDLINAGADVNARNSLSETPLHVASEKNDICIVKLLVEAGADVAARALFDETALDYARNEGATTAEAELARLSK
jgi:uncharacterized protein